MSSNLLIRDVQEKEVGESKPPTFPQPTSSSTGFPEHKKRVRTSAFRRQNDGTTAKQTSTSPPPNPPNGAPEPTLSFEESEKRRIDQENRAKLDDMSPEDIAKAQRDLLNGLDPTIIQMLLRRANLDDQSGGPSPFDSPAAARTAPDPQLPEEEHPQSPSLPGEDATKATNAPDAAHRINNDTPITKASKRQVAFNEDAQPSKPPEDLFSLTAGPPQSSSSSSEPRPPRVHFPPAPQPPDLDPSDPDFLTNLHSKYFPTLPADPSKLAWMAPLPQPDTPADRASPYHPSNADESSEGLPAAALRFDFRGALLPPRLSRALPAHLGLHHHGDAPEAAGYTVAELARLARSAVPAQRCLAFQTLGRVAYRLGTGRWGRAAASAAVIGGDDASATQGRQEEDDGQKADNEALSQAIWESFEEGRVVETLTDAASVPEGQGHRGSRAYAMEALWLLEKGGWKPKVTQQDA